MPKKNEGQENAQNSVTETGATTEQTAKEVTERHEEGGTDTASVETVGNLTVLRKKELKFTAEEEAFMADLRQAGLDEKKVTNMANAFQPQTNEMPERGVFGKVYLSAEAKDQNTHHLRVQILDKVGGEVVGDVSLSNIQISGASGEQDSLPTVTTPKGTFIKIAPLNQELARKSKIQLALYLTGKRYIASRVNLWVRDYNVDASGAVRGHASATEAREKASAKGCYKITIQE